MSDVDKKLNELEKLLNKSKLGYAEIQEQLGVDYAYARKLMQLLKDRGATIETSYFNGRKYFWHPPKEPIPTDGFKSSYKIDRPDNYTFAIIGDTHLGSVYSAKEELHDFYDLLESRGVTLVIHAGDVFEGQKSSRRTQLNEIEVYGYDKVLDFVEEFYPRRAGIKTVMISGNHDNWFWDDVGANIVKELAKRRDDIDYAGFELADIYINDEWLINHHPGGGSAYARSYKLQKYINELKDRPDFYVMGHFHKALYLPYVGVHGFLAGSFKKADPFSNKFAGSPDVGGWIVHVRKFDDKMSVSTEWVSYE